MSKNRRAVWVFAALGTVLLLSTGVRAADFETTIDFALNTRATLDGEAGKVKAAAVEFATSFAKKGLLGTDNPDLKALVTARLECTNASADKWKVDAVVEFLDGDGEVIDRTSGGMSLKNGSKTLELKLTTLKWVVPRIEQVRIRVQAKDKG